MLASTAIRSCLSSRGLYYIGFLLCLAYGFWATAVAAAPQSKSYSESQIKVAVVYKLMHFIGWQEDSPVTLCVYKPNDEDSASFNLMPPQMESGAPLTITFLHKNGDSFREQHCHIIFFSKGTESDIQHILDTVTDEKRLTIGETSQFIKQGGMINLVRKDSTIKFEINIAALKQADLSISSQVLRIAEQVYTDDDSD